MVPRSQQGEGSVAKKSAKEEARSVEDSLKGLTLDDLEHGERRAEAGTFSTTTDYILMDPRAIERDGPYVRDVDDEPDESIDNFITSIQESGEVRHPIGVRTEGTPTHRRFILVYGDRRLRAALNAGLERVPVRDFGFISEDEAILLQLEENLNRQEMSPAATAVAFHLAVQQGTSQQDLAARTGRAPGYISEMVRAGAGLARLSDEERAGVEREGRRFTFRLLQKIARIPSAEDRAQELRRLLEDGSPPGEAGPKGPVRRSEFRDGGGLVIRWKDRDLVNGADALIEEAHQAFREEMQTLGERLERLVQTKRLSEDAARKARQRIDQLLE